MPKKFKIQGVTCICRPTLITIKNSYKIDYVDAEKFCRKLKIATNMDYTRSIKSWTSELIAHKFLYDKKLFVSHVKDTDLDEFESLHRRVAYKVIHLIYNLFYRET